MCVCICVCVISRYHIAISFRACTLVETPQDPGNHLRVSSISLSVQGDATNASLPNGTAG